LTDCTKLAVSKTTKVPVKTVAEKPTVKKPSVKAETKVDSKKQVSQSNKAVKSQNEGENKSVTSFKDFLDQNNFNPTNVDASLSSEERYKYLKDDFSRLCDIETMLEARRADYLQSMDELYKQFSKCETGATNNSQDNEPDVDDELESGTAKTQSKKNTDSKTASKKVVKEEDEDDEEEEDEEEVEEDEEVEDDDDEVEE